MIPIGKTKKISSFETKNSLSARNLRENKVKESSKGKRCPLWLSECINLTSREISERFKENSFNTFLSWLSSSTMSFSHFVLYVCAY